MKLPLMLLAFALVPAARLAAQEPQPSPPAQEETAAVPQETVSATPAGGDAQTHIDAGLSAFRKRHFGAARQHFEQAVAADPSNAAANFYLGYTIYKIAEPKRPFHPDKQKAAELFAKAYQLDPQFKPAWSKRG